MQLGKIFSYVKVAPGTRALAVAEASGKGSANEEAEIVEEPGTSRLLVAEASGEIDDNDEAKSDEEPGPSGLAVEEASNVSTDVTPPTISPGKVTPLTGDEKESIREIFKTEIAQGQKQEYKKVRNKMCTTTTLRTLIFKPSKVKQVVNHVNYLVSIRPSQDLWSTIGCMESMKIVVL